MKLLLVLLLVVFTKGCPPWTIYNNSSGQCQCGNSLGGVVHCNRETLKVSVLHCYCMTYNRQTNVTLVGHWIYRCMFSYSKDGGCKSHKEVKSNDSKLLNQEMCGLFKRTGQLCGECIEGHGAPVYSYSLKCVKCEESDFRYNLFKYIAVAFLPLTVFYLVVIIFKISVTSGSMVAYVLICQILTTPVLMRYLLKRLSIGAKYLFTFISVWNLDICRLLYEPFCIHPEMSTLQVLALDYVVGIYPLVLIFLTYIAVTLHDRYPLIVKIWKPAYKCFICIRREWNIRGSLIQAFSTFLVLSYVKILNVSFDLLIPVVLQTVEGKRLKQIYLYYAGNIPYFGREHLPYGISAVAMVTLFNILPAILLLVYPCLCMRKIMNKYKLHSHTLHTFMDTFQGCYRHQPRDCRYFAFFYLLLRIFILVSFAIVRDEICIAFIAFYFQILTIAVLTVRPYKKRLHDIIDGGFFTLCICMSLALLTHKYIEIFISKRNIMHKPVQFCISSIPILCGSYGCLMLIHKILPKKLQSLIKICLNKMFYVKPSNFHEVDEQQFPHRLYQQEQYTPLV